MAYQDAGRLYFQGVDATKLNESGDLVLLCGGARGRLQDIFLTPWQQFFDQIRVGRLVNAYRPPKEYWQFKFKVRPRDSRWLLAVQGDGTPQVDVAGFRYPPNEAVDALR